MYLDDALECLNEAIEEAIERAGAEARKDAERLLSPMECGHPLAAWEEDDDGHYCAWCESLEQAREARTIEVLEAVASLYCGDGWPIAAMTSAEIDALGNIDAMLTQVRREARKDTKERTSAYWRKRLEKAREEERERLWGAVSARIRNLSALDDRMKRDFELEMRDVFDYGQE